MDDGIVVVRSGRNAAMEVADVGPALQERLGDEGTAALVDLFDVARQEWAADVTTAAIERFERRLSDEVGTLRADIRSIEANLRLEMTRGFAAVRQEMTTGLAAFRREMTTEFAAVRQEMTSAFAAVRQEMTTGLAAVRQEMTNEFAAVRRGTTTEFAAVRQEITGGFAAFRQDLGTQRFELLKWCFAFWLGQLIAVATIMGLMLRLMQG
jgi:hypothetical protein